MQSIANKPMQKRREKSWSDVIEKNAAVL